MKKMELHYRKTGNGPKTVVILHGLFGSSKNWVSNAAALDDVATVYSVDLRNHGDSPHAATHSLQELTDDVMSFIAAHDLDRPVLIGHSMGGLVAIVCALTNPAMVGGVVIVDIAPKFYPRGHEREFEALRLDVSTFSSREQVDDAMASIIPDRAVRQFLQMNLERTENRFRWKLNVPVLEHASWSLSPELLGDRRYTGAALFVVGGRSDYVKPDDHATIRTFFPNGEIVTLPDGDHWLHYSSASDFLAIVRPFLETL